MNEYEKNMPTDEKVQDKATVKAEHKRFSALDFGFIVLIVLIVLGVGFRTVIANWIVRSAPEEAVMVSFKAEGITKEQLEQIKVSDTYTLSEKPFATLKSFTFTPYETKIEQKNEKGEVSFVTAEDPNRFTVYGAVEVSGNYTESGFVCLDDVNLYVGKILNIEASSYSITVIITEIPRK